MAMEASEVAVRVRLVGGTAFEKEAQAVSGSIREIGKAGRETDAANSLGLGGATAAQLDTFSKKVKSVGGAVMGLGQSILPASMAIAGLGYYASKAQTQFQSSMMRLATQAGLPRKHIQGLTTDVLGLSRAIGQTPDALAQGAFPIVSDITKNRSQIMGILKVAGEMATIGGDTVNNTGRALTSVMSTYGKRSPAFAKLVATEVEAAIGQGKMTMPELTQSFGTSILPMMKATHTGLDQMLATVAVLSRMGVDPTTAMSRMRLSLTSVTSPTNEGLKALQTMGLGRYALSNDLRRPNGLMTMLTDLSEHSQALKPAARMNVIAELFGRSRGIGNISALLNALPQLSHAAYAIQTQAHSSILDQHFGWAKHTSAFQKASMKAQLDVAMIKLGAAINKDLLPVLVKLVGYLTKAVDAFGKLPGPLQKAIVIFGAIVVVFGPFLVAIGGIIRAFGILIGAVRSVIEFASFLVEGFTVATAGLALLVAGVAIVAFIFRKQLWDAIKAVAGFIAGEFMAVWRDLKQDVGKVGNLFGALWRATQAVIRFFLHLGSNVIGGAGHVIGHAASSVWHDLTGWIPGLANGGIVQSSGMTLVGERGPELLDLPRGSTVTPLPATGLTMLNTKFGEGAGQISITVNQVLDGRILSTSIANIQRQQLNRK